MLAVGLVSGCVAAPRPLPAKVAQASSSEAKRVVVVHHRTVVRAAAKVCVPDPPPLDDAKRDELFRQFDQEVSKRAGQ